MIMKFVRKKNTEQSNVAYSKQVINYIIKPEIPSPEQHTQMIEKCIYYEVHGCISADPETQAWEFGSMADGAHATAKNVLKHYVLSWRKDEKPTIQQITQAVIIYLKDQGYDLKTAQWMFGIHANTDQIHVHIFVNRMNPETEKLLEEGNGWWVKQGLRALAHIEHVQGWKPEKHALFKWNPDTGKAESTKKKAKPKWNRVSEAALRIELETGVYSVERIVKEACAAVVEAIKQLSPEQKNWPNIHRLFAQAGLDYQKAKNTGAIVDAGERTFSASKILDDFGLKAMEKIVGSTYRKPKSKEAEDLEKVRKEVREKLFAAPLPLPKRLLPAKSRSKYLQGWNRGRFQNRLNEEQFRMRARQHSLQKIQQEISHEMR